jgi:hypothetical protein
VKATETPKSFVAFLGRYLKRQVGVTTDGNKVGNGRTNGFSRSVQRPNQPPTKLPITPPPKKLTTRAGTSVTRRKLEEGVGGAQAGVCRNHGKCQVSITRHQKCGVLQAYST